MAMKLSTTLRHIDTIPDNVNAEVVKEFHDYLKEIGTSENYQNQNHWCIVTHNYLNID
jgi:hypothetical protein